MNNTIEELYKKLDAQDKIINTQALEIARLKEKIDKAVEYIEVMEYNESYGKKYIDYHELLEILGDKE